MRLLLRSASLALATCVACEGSGTLEGVEVTDGGVIDCVARGDGAPDDLVPRCRGIGLVDARAVDLLFVIDDGMEAGALQTRLADAMDGFSAMIAALDPQPELRIAFTSSRDANPFCESDSKTGAGRLSLSSCASRPDSFVDSEGTDRFAELCTDRCALDRIDTVPTALGVDDPAKSRSWLEISGDETNLAPGTAIDDALRCASLLGVAECPFPAPASATKYAFLRAAQDDGQPEVGFFRPDAAPILVWVTSGAECSLGTMGISAFDPNGSRALWTDPDAATPGLCWNAGVECSAPDASGAMICAARDVDAEGISASPDDAVLLPVEQIGDFLGDVAAWRAEYNPGNRLHLLAITGVPDGPAPTFAPEDSETAARYGVQPTCVLDGDALLPPIRDAVLVTAPPTDLLEAELLSACTDDFEPALARVADAIASSIRLMCMPACVADVDPDTAGLQAECTVEVETPAADGGAENFALAPCDVDANGKRSIPGDEPGCFVMRTGAALRQPCADPGYNLEFDVLWNGPKPPGTSFLPHCELSEHKDVDCPDL